jgi:hypothetical protein
MSERVRVMVDFSLRRLQVENVAETAPASRKEWEKPELRKIDIEQITAHHFGTGHDSRGHHS